ncbi:uncharacterized protein BO95DRAFT_160341 [Aspergillus brunneoviolaceus CBS 621.78]|uniref:Uncharacterized protein n=1 Tax=Aspergillus brunneoviolaceus CBS 621.78 TaxID=1450534 RepID=A0ACD1GN64_9EURO|nr:hypothetical protein BO95DRAFT_160341 [Aspergillus brunneoviolaceus CBS 621.78]RAH50724.1 hypothetical protein BO95DRAFT_160341 [Aspergillus brunneoviolaceus CBS 621.78]
MAALVVQAHSSWISRLEGVRCIDPDLDLVGLCCIWARQRHHDFRPKLIIMSCACPGFSATAAVATAAAAAAVAAPHRNVVTGGRTIGLQLSLFLPRLSASCGRFPDPLT